MAWSIFNYPNAGAVATAWAVELLNVLGIPANPSNVKFIFDWEVSEGGGGAYNPLNQGPVPGKPQLTTTGQQYGGGAADFASWQAGIEGAADYLNMGNYSGVLAALKGGDYQAMAQALWDSPWASSHYGYGSRWNTSAYQPMSPAQVAQTIDQYGMNVPGSTAGGGGQGTPSPAGTTSGGGTTTQPAASYGGQPLTMADLPNVLAWIRQNWPQYSWLLSNSEVAAVLEQAAVQGLSTNQVQAMIAQTEWWKTTTNAMRQFEEDMAINPADYQFGTAGSKAANMYGQVAAAAGNAGVYLTGAQMQTIALNALKFGWQTPQIQEAIGALANPRNALGVAQQLNTVADDYYMTPGAASMDNWIRGIASGTQNLQQFQGQMTQDAALKWTGYARQLQSGLTMKQLTDNMRTEAAKTMEVDPTSINFATDPTYMRILDYVPPNPVGAKPGESQPHRVMTLSEMDQYLKGLPQYGFTQNARNSVADLAQQIVQDFGRAPTGG